MPEPALAKSSVIRLSTTQTVAVMASILLRTRGPSGDGSAVEVLGRRSDRAGQRLPAMVDG